MKMNSLIWVNQMLHLNNSIIISSESNLFISDTKNPTINLITPNDNQQFEQNNIEITWEADDDSFQNNAGANASGHG